METITASHAGGVKTRPSALDSLLNISSYPPCAPALASSSSATAGRTTFKVDSSNLLTRLGSFLPQLQAANTLLDEKMKAGILTAEDVDIEAVCEDDPHITMVGTHLIHSSSLYYAFTCYYYWLELGAGCI
jgi:hypothetical protein